MATRTEQKEKLREERIERSSENILRNGKNSNENIAKYEGPENKKKLEIKRHFTSVEKDPYESVEWGIRDAVAGDFEQKGVEAPVCWSDSAVGIVAKLYFATIDGRRESSIKTLIKRVVTKITDEGEKHGYFDEVDACTFKDELTYILINQIAAFNTPVWLNLGVPGRKQCASACYLLNVEDTMFGEDSITDWWVNEAKIFKTGAGSGVNLSKIRGSMEPISVGGIASGPVSFMRVADANAGTIKSGSVARRAAKLVCLDVDHPDILDFIDSKVREDERMRALMAAGVNLDPSTPEGEKNIAECTSFQNANISVRLSDKFMEAVESDEIWDLNVRVSHGENPLINCINARELLERIAEAAWKCADPGVMFDDTINKWHTTPSLGRINTANPCCETMLNDNTSCNLGSLNLVKFLNKDNSFRFQDFNQTVDIMITAKDIMCSFSEHPTEKITENTRNLRQLGFGYSNLGAALMIQGMPYDSNEGRDWAASVTSLMTGRAYRRSAELAEFIGCFGSENGDSISLGGLNSVSMDQVLTMHMNHCNYNRLVDGNIWPIAAQNWQEAWDNGRKDGYRNSQVTVIAPTGTISFMMDCDTTGAEPAYSLVTYKKLASGGNMTLINNSVKKSLENLGYSDNEIGTALELYKRNGFLSCAEFPTVNDEHLKVFQTAAGEDSISYQGHLDMVAAIQPHISGAVSKTTNLPNDVTVEDIYNIYIGAWQRGIKCLSVYRDGSKATQVLHTKKDISVPDSADDEFSEKVKEEMLEKSRIENSPNVKSPENVLQYIDSRQKLDEKIAHYESPFVWKDKKLPAIYTNFPDKKDTAGNRPTVSSRKRLNDDRASLTHKFSLGDHEGYITAGMYEDGTLGEIFLSGLGKEGSTLKGVLEGWAIAISMGLQHGVPLESFARKFSSMSFEPRGLTNNSEIRNAHSILDYVMRWLISKFGDHNLHQEFGVMTDKVKSDHNSQNIHHEEAFVGMMSGFPNDYTESANTLNMTGKICSCGSIMIQSGVCFSCRNCGNTSGCG